MKTNRLTRWFASAMAVASLTTFAGAIGTTASASTVSALPPGVRYDYSVHPLAGRNASVAAKENAVLREAASKLGTPYIWGHNEDRGQYGFDCSNFTAYVYHHALGYRMSGASQVQYHSVGWRVPVSQMRPGDLVIFDRGGHVGIYAGNGRMIEEGGGLGKVGYLPLHPGSYWYRHITTVKRMFN
jgi:cell wall-associated NlpC family hydrolase